MNTDILFSIIILCLVGLLAFRDWQHQKNIRAILSARLSRDVGEFKMATEDTKPPEKEPEEVELPLEDMPAEDMLRVLNK